MSLFLAGYSKAKKLEKELEEKFNECQNGELNLKSVKLKNVTILKKLATKIESTNLEITSLNLTSTSIQDIGISILFNYLKSNKTIKKLYLGTNGITESSAHLIADIISTNDTIDTLDLQCNKS